MPRSRLVEYMQHLAVVLGDPRHVHLIKVETGSTIHVLRVDAEAIENTRRREIESRTGIAPGETMEAYRIINRMLREDKTRAALYEGEAEIIRFPGQEEPPAVISGVKQHGRLDGHLQRVGGAARAVG